VKRISILLLEDQPLDADLTFAQLKREDVAFDCKRVVTREDFAAELHHGGYDVILADYGLPNFDGLSALKLAREKSPRTPFIFVSGEIGEEIAVNSMREGATDYVLKGSLKRLGSSLRRALVEAQTRAERQAARDAMEKLNAELEERVQERTEELLKSRMALQRAHNLEAIGRLAGGVAHDFNNLMTGIIGISEELRDQMENPVWRDDLNEIHQAAQRAAELTKQLLAFGRRQPAAPRVLNLNSVIAGMRGLFNRLLHENIQLEIVSSTENGVISSDPSQVEQVALNLVLNARDAAAAGGTLTVRTGRARLEEASSERYLNAPSGDYVMLEVCDTGAGIAPENLAHLFEPFFTTKETGQGTGLGLATVYGIMQQNNGDISVSTAKGSGTCFRVYWPSADGLVPAAAPAVKNKRDLRGAETILLAEDQDIVRRIATRSLRRQGYRVLEAADGEAALLLLKTEPGPIDLLLTDVVMPNMNGRELAAEVKKKRPGISVLYMSGHDEKIIMSHGILEAGLSFIGKTFTPEALCRKVREVLDAHKSAV
jgi:two-component system, cell cycle sensor histidine kinase and response regulator CckA